MPKDPLPDPDSPYIAHLRVREGGVCKDYFLGQSSHLDAALGVRVVDWRVAPVARIFYGYREGDEYEEEFPGRVAEGTLEARRILVIEGGELQKLVTDRFVLTLTDGRMASRSSRELRHQRWRHGQRRARGGLCRAASRGTARA